jgi:hypothetical protein
MGLAQRYRLLAAHRLADQRFPTRRDAAAALAVALHSENLLP